MSYAHMTLAAASMPATGSHGTCVSVADANGESSAGLSRESSLSSSPNSLNYIRHHVMEMRPALQDSLGPNAKSMLERTEINDADLVRVQSQ